MISRPILFFLLFCFSILSNAQIDTLLSKIKFETDFRFRAEQDWDSRKSDGSFRNDRSRLRYRLRTGATYKNDWYSLGFRIRTGEPNKQQDPQLTLGKGFEEFGTLPIGFEKIFFQANWKNFKVWAGKNTYPFEKSNELFWSDNVFPEGVSLGKQFAIKSNFLESIKLNAGHFILISNDESITDDAYFQGFQTSLATQNQSITVFPSIYFFRNIPNIPDGDHSFFLDYTIVHFGTRIQPIRHKPFSIEFDYYQNIENYDGSTVIEADFRDQKTGHVVAVQYGSLQKARDWMTKVTFASLERYSILDFMAQNDWARWDYSSNNSPDGRLSNFRGVEIVLAYSLSKKINLVTKYYVVEQLVPLGASKETGQRIRFDIDIKI